MSETGWFAHLWHEMAGRLGLVTDFVKTDWRRGADVAAIEAKLREDKSHAIKAVCVVHNETSTGATSRIDEVRKAIDAAGHPALLLVDTISSLASIDYRHDEWGVDVTVAGSQKGLMLPPGLSFNAISEKALKASETAKLPRSFWDWKPMLAANATGYFPYTPATNLLYGAGCRVDMLLEEGLENVFSRHDRHAEATRRACATGASRSSARTRATTPPRSRRCACRRGRAPMRCAPPSSEKVQHVARQRASASSTTGCSASGISAISATCSSSARSAAWRWG
jgi:alanine-glyoxylate transaminase/serine-glyoxylate transaminase/serine-pyruvate transaminase